MKERNLLTNAKLNARILGWVKPNDDLCDYLAGLFEGDGTLHLPKRSDKGRLNYPIFSITFDIRDLPLATKIYETLDFGSVTSYPKSNSCRFTVLDYTGLIKLVLISENN